MLQNLATVIDKSSEGRLAHIESAVLLRAPYIGDNTLGIGVASK